MTAVSLVIIVQSVIELVEGAPKNAAGAALRTKPFTLVSAIVVAVAFTVKLMLFFYCFSLRNIYSQVRVLWEDHRNDLLINGIGLAFSLMGSFVRWWIDPMGAILLSITVIFLWQRTALEEFKLLVGVTADTTTLQLITYICKYLHVLNLRSVSGGLWTSELPNLTNANSNQGIARQIYANKLNQQ